MVAVSGALPLEKTRGGVRALDADAAWAQVVGRDAAAAFVYAVTTTGVFCRPGCASRRPRRENVRFFASAREAEAAGFRACQRCRPTTASSGSLDRVRGYIEAHVDGPVRLKELGRVAGMSPFTVQRRFKEAMGVSPLKYQRALRAGNLRQALKGGATVTDAIYEAGFGSSSRAYEGAGLGMTPARFAEGGRGERIGFTTARTAFGWMIVGATERGLCWLALAGSATEAEASLREEFPAAELKRDAGLKRLVDEALRVVSGQAGAGAELGLDLRGTVFQLRVWQALREIPRGETRSYSELAREMGEPKATRAVARACAMNRVALVVPCHRVVGASGSLTGYRWGVDRKRALLEAERREAASSR
ncbi:MAG: methylated-DNA--[protein]-cysteine S-methyltransferase [Acidobacteriota bacterium]|nr:methylated-DNA--[protein]-cysteine S-methyltransferase [Acidobacteriota bacterium]